MWLGLYDTRVERPKARGGGDDRGGGGRGGGSGGSRGDFRVTVEDLPSTGSWQDLKDFCRNGGVQGVLYTEASGREGIIEFGTEDDARHAIKNLDDTRFKSHMVNVHTHTCAVYSYAALDTLAVH